MVSHRGIKVNPKKTQAIQEINPVVSAKEVQHFAGRIATLNHFFFIFSECYLLFFKIFKQLKNFWWTKKCQKVFDELKHYLSSTPLLSKP